ncbi:MAG: HupE/UreJ family protein [Thalassobaculum sp.]|uniref:HupE/UreJ family protein n=1 Tax=Thalassobaculum sp. TaxID=2022740 RepID=UPI0032EE4768
MVRPTLLAALVLLVAFPASAQQDSGFGSLIAGFAHPVLGFDHLLAMVAVGLLSVQIGGRAVWTVPAAFVVFLEGGNGLGLAGVPLPQVEGVIALSVLALGLAIALSVELPALVAIAVVGVFAVFHGHAHGEEIPNLAGPLGFVAGFMLASALLHLAGVGLGVLAARPQLRALLGAGCAGIGLHMLLLSYEII